MSDLLLAQVCDALADHGRIDTAEACAVLLTALVNLANAHPDREALVRSLDEAWLQATCGYR